MPKTITPSEKAIGMAEKWENDPANFDGSLSWPGGGSGITLGYGYDLGYSSSAQVRDDWGSLVPGATLDAMLRCVGMIGTSARGLLPLVRGFHVTQAAAGEVFREIDVPRYSRMARQAFPNADELSGDSFGALWATVMNRGAAMSDAPGWPNSRLEMRQIRDACEAREFKKVPDYFRSMCRLWVGHGLDGLLVRYRETAQLFQDGLAGKTPAVQPSPDAPDASTEKEELGDAESSEVTAESLNQSELDRIAAGKPATS